MIVTKPAALVENREICNLFSRNSKEVEVCGEEFAFLVTFKDIEKVVLDKKTKTFTVKENNVNTTYKFLD